MRGDPDNYYEEEYWEEIGRQEEIAAAIKNLSEDPIREFLGTYGDAIDARVVNTVAQARYASQSGFPGGRFAVGTGISRRLKMTRPTQAAHLLLPQFAQ
jgi:hypothetical protein